MATRQGTPRARSRVAREAIIQEAIALFEVGDNARQKRYRIRGVGDVAAYAVLQLAERDTEAMFAFYLDAGYRVLQVQQVGLGTLTHTPIMTREIARGALMCNAGGVILAHNHPSGSLEFSMADELATEEVRRALQIVEVQLLDHLLVAGARWLSLERVKVERNEAEVRRKAPSVRKRRRSTR